jgi:hypothetical protein
VTRTRAPRPGAVQDGTTTPARAADAASLRRRLRLADAWRYRLDAALAAIGRRRNRWLSDVPYLAGNLAVDLVEVLRTGGRVPHPGHAYLATLDAPAGLPQDPRYRGYWYEPGSHSLVGLQLGLDLNRHEGKYHVVESNTGAAMRPERRLLYDSDLDPVISELVGLAQGHGFERLVLLRQWWSEAEAEEFRRAARGTGLEVVGATMAAVDTMGHPPVNPMVALPERLLPRTMYVVFSPLNKKAPLPHFLHDKACTARWLAESLAEAGDPASRLAGVPTFDRLVVPPEPPGGRWPNLVVKLADADQGKAIAMGRFATEEEARRALRLGDRPGSVPGVFRTELPQKVLHVLSPGTAKALYQPFVPTDVVEGRARLIRLHVLVSPLAGAFLSAHGVLAAADLPDHLPPGLVRDKRPYVVNFSAGSRYCRLPREVEAELREVARDFARLADRAIRKRFLVSP